MWRVVLVLVFAAVGATGLCNATFFGKAHAQIKQATATTTYTPSLSGVARVVLRTFRGNIRVTRRADLLLSATRYGPNTASLGNATVGVKRTGKTLQIDSRDVSKDLQPREDYGVDLELALPPGVALDLQSEDGTISVTGMTGKLTLRLGRGTLLLRDLANVSVDAELSRGAIEAKDVQFAEGGNNRMVTGFGGVRLLRPQFYPNAQVLLEALVGSVNCALPGFAPSGTKTAQTWRRLGPGKLTSLVVKSSTGAIVVLPRE